MLWGQYEHHLDAGIQRGKRMLLVGFPCNKFGFLVTWTKIWLFDCFTVWVKWSQRFKITARSLYKHLGRQWCQHAWFQHFLVTTFIHLLCSWQSIHIVVVLCSEEHVCTDLQCNHSFSDTPHFTVKFPRVGVISMRYACHSLSTVTLFSVPLGPGRPAESLSFSQIDILLIVQCPILQSCCMLPMFHRRISASGFVSTSYHGEHPVPKQLGSCPPIHAGLVRLESTKIGWVSREHLRVKVQERFRLVLWRTKNSPDIFNFLRPLFGKQMSNSMRQNVQRSALRQQKFQLFTVFLQTKIAAITIKYLLLSIRPVPVWH